VDAFATEPLAQVHVVGHRPDMREPQTPESGGNILGNRLVAFPGTTVLGFVKHTVGFQLIAAEYHGDAQARLQRLDPVLQAARWTDRLFCGPARHRHRASSCC
jgi:hypothetical protein